MIKLLDYDTHLSQIMEVIESRTSFMTIQDRRPPSLDFIQVRDIFNHNMCFGCFNDDETLDSFIYHIVWGLYPAYSSLLYTRKSSTPRIKNDLGIDQNLSDLWDYSVDYMGVKLNLWVHYQATVAENWKTTGPNVVAKSLCDDIEYIPSMQLSKYPIIRAQLLGRPVEKDMIVKRYVMKPEERIDAKLRIEQA